LFGGSGDDKEIALFAFGLLAEIIEGSLPLRPAIAGCPAIIDEDGDRACAWKLCGGSDDGAREAEEEQAQQSEAQEDEPPRCIGGALCGGSEIAQEDERGEALLLWAGWCEAKEPPEQGDSGEAPEGEGGEKLDVAEKIHARPRWRLWACAAKW